MTTEERHRLEDLGPASPDPARVTNAHVMGGREGQNHVAQVRLDTAPLAPVEGIADRLDRGQRHQGHQEKPKDTKRAGELASPCHPSVALAQFKVRGQGRIGGDGQGTFLVPVAVVVRGQQNDGHNSVYCDQKESDQTQLFPELEPGVQKLREASVLRAVVDL